jgi:hypothetical protein
LALTGFQQWKGCFAAAFSRQNCSSETYLAGSKTCNIGPDRLSKAPCAAPKHLFPNKSEGFDSPVLKSFEKVQQLLL